MLLLLLLLYKMRFYSSSFWVNFWTKHNTQATTTIWFIKSDWRLGLKPIRVYISHAIVAFNCIYFKHRRCVNRLTSRRICDRAFGRWLYATAVRFFSIPFWRDKTALGIICMVNWIQLWDLHDRILGFVCLFFLCGSCRCWALEHKTKQILVILSLGWAFETRELLSFSLGM